MHASLSFTLRTKAALTTPERTPDHRRSKFDHESIRNIWMPNNFPDHPMGPVPQFPSNSGGGRQPHVRGGESPGLSRLASSNRTLVRDGCRSASRDSSRSSRRGDRRRDYRCGRRAAYRDAGDGKTAVCVNVAAALGFDEDLLDVTAIKSWTIVKDASEVDEERLEEIIASHLSGRANGGKLLIAINEGRLRRLVHRGERGANTAVGGRVLTELWEPVIEPALAAWIDAEQAQALDEAMRSSRVAVVNFRHRMHVRATVPRLLARWTVGDQWEDSPACSVCDANQRCPILANATGLRNETTQSRVAEILVSAHFSGHRLPFRRLQAVLAIACTGGLRCADVQTGGLVPESASALELLQYRFYEAIFHRSPARPSSSATRARLADVLAG